MENNTFINALKQTLANNSNISITENGAIGYSTTGKKILDLTFQIPSLRNASEDEIKEKFMEAYLEDPIVAAIWLFYVRDVREGLGERRLFRACVEFLASKTTNLDKFIELIPEYGRFDDLFVLLNNANYRDHVISFIKKQLEKDLEAQKQNKPVSLLAKWLKSENTSSKESQAIAHIIRRGLGLSHKEYRQMLSLLRAYIDVVEVKMSSCQFDKIDYETVPSRASLIYKEAFKRNDKERYTAFINAVQTGHAKINASVLYPHEIVAKYGNGYGLRPEDATLEALWNNLPDLTNGSEGTLVVADGSGSMTCRVGSGSTVRALDVANGLALYFAQRAKGAFKNTYITFSSKPQLVQVGTGTLRGDLKIAYRHNECSNTNIEATFDLILQTAIDNKMTQEDMPKNILIISDMEFDMASHGYSWTTRTGFPDPSEGLFTAIRKKFEDNGYKLPRLVFWNVNSRTNTIPVKENELGVSLVSGFSVNILKMVLSGELDPYKNLLETLFVDRYKPLLECFND